MHFIYIVYMLKLYLIQFFLSKQIKKEEKKSPLLNVELLYAD